jgi:hypothetical protein
MIKKILPGLILLIVGIVLGAGALFAWNLFAVKNPSNVSTQAQQAQVKEILTKVGNLIILPTGEEPVVATITDASSLIKDQVFYKGAQNGDVVIVYQKAAKAIVYSPERNIIVNVGPVFLQDQAATSPTEATPATTTKK